MMKKQGEIKRIN